MCAELPSVFQTAVECDGLGGACTAGLGGASASQSLPFLLKAWGCKRKSQSLESLQQKSSGTEATGRDESSFSTEENLSLIAPNICLPTLLRGWKCPSCETADVARDPAPTVSQTLGLARPVPMADGRWRGKLSPSPLFSLSHPLSLHPACLLEVEFGFGWHTDSGFAS